MSARPKLQVWAIAEGDIVLTVTVLCPEHAAWSRAPDFYLPPGRRAFRVRAKAMVREVLQRGSGCTECAWRSGRRLKISLGPDPGVLTTRHLEQEGGDA